MARGKYQRRRIMRERRAIAIHDSGFSCRVIKILEANGIRTMAELDMKAEEELKNIPGIGEKAMDEIRKKRIRKER